MEIAAFVVAVLAVLAAGASALYARGANTRADTANERAADALDLQKRIDDRQREFRLVRWSASWDPLAAADTPTVWLRNTGLTPAVDVTLLVKTFVDEKMFRFERVEPGEKVEAIFGAPDAAHAAFHFVRDSVCRVHWSSPRGEVHEIDAPIKPMNS